MLTGGGTRRGTTMGATRDVSRLATTPSSPISQRTDTVAAEPVGASGRWLAAVLIVLFAVVIAWPIAVSTVSRMDWPVRIAVNLSPFLAMVGALIMAARSEGLRLATAFGWSTAHLGRQLLTALALLAVTLSLTLVPALMGISVVGRGETRPLVFMYLAVRQFVLVGFVEEFAWRGYVLGGVRRALGSGPWAVLLSSLLFGLWHFPGGHDVAQVLVTALIGAVYATALLKIRHCTTLATGTAHGLHDFALLLIASLSG
jgi:membrane protease YdiL (CAAX protease family)